MEYRSLFIAFFYFLSNSWSLPAQNSEYALSWEKCALSNKDENMIAKCAKVNFPLFYGQPDGPLIQIATKSLLANRESRAQLWFIDGGPGDSGIESLNRLKEFSEHFGDIDIYTLDHRGVGGSERLRCPEQEAVDSEEGKEVSGSEWPACIKHLMATYGDRLLGMSTTESAHDLARLIAATREPGKKVFIWGVSYGTVLVNRYLHLYPKQPDGVILDGLVPADWTFSEFDENLNSVAEKFMEQCSADSICAKYLGHDPINSAKKAAESLEDGPCKILNLKPEVMRLLTGVLFMSGKPLRDYIPALLYRVNRCETRDIWALVHLFNNLFGDENGIGEPDSHSQPLSFHVSASELWSKDALSAETYRTKLKNYVMTTGLSASMAAAFKGWPVYKVPDFHDTFADYAGPVLMLQGGLDPTMPLERLDAMVQHFSGSNQQFVVFPHGQHVVLNEGDCALSIYKQFLYNPETSIDISCIQNEPATNFTGDRETSKRIFGTTDMWGDKYVQSPMRYYLSLGVAWPLSPSANRISRKASADFRAGIGVVLNRRWELIASSTFNHFGLDKNNIIDRYGSGGVSESVRGDAMSQTSAFINAKYSFSDFFLASHAIIGAGFQNISAGDVTILGDSGKEIISGQDGTSFSLDLGLGISFSTSAGFQILLEPHYVVGFDDNDLRHTLSLSLGIKLGR